MHKNVEESLNHEEVEFLRTISKEYEIKGHVLPIRSVGVQVSSICLIDISMLAGSQSRDSAANGIYMVLCILHFVIVFYREMVDLLSMLQLFLPIIMFLGRCYPAWEKLFLEYVKVSAGWLSCLERLSSMRSNSSLRLL